MVATRDDRRRPVVRGRMTYTLDIDTIKRRAL
jgi:hypothetical protein